MFLRLALLTLPVAALGLLWLTVVLGATHRRHNRVNRMREPSLSQGKATVLFFTADYCTVCHHRQRPALDTLAGQLNGGLRVVEIDAVAEASLAKRFGVLSLPTTVVLAPDGTVGAVNYGFAPGDQLRAQVVSVG